MRFLDKIKYNRSYFLFLFIMILFNTFYLQKAMSGVVQNNIILLLVLLLIMVVEIIISYLIYHFNLNKKYPIEKLFLLFFVPLGFLYMIVLPMAGTPDEAVHFYRAYEVSMGHVTSVSKGELNGRQMPKSLLELFKNTQRFDQIKYKDTLKSFQIQLNKEKKQFINFPSSALYSPVCYLPQAFGIFIGRILNFNPAVIFYLGRIMNFLSFVIIVYFALKYLPIKKISCCLLLFLPTVFQAAISLSPDALTIAVTVALVSFILYMKYSKTGTMNSKEYGILFLLTLFISMLKIVYLPLSLLVLGIPKERFSSSKEKWIKLGSLLCIVVLLNLLWLWNSSRFLVPIVEGVNSKSQIQFILSSPFKYINILMNTFMNNYMLYLMTALGQSLGWLQITLPGFYVFLYFLLLVIVILLDQDKKRKLEKNEKEGLAGIIFLIALLIFTSIYIQANPVENGTIIGVQGRYFLPLALTGMFLFENRLSYPLQEKFNYCMVFAVFLNIVALMQCFCYHIV